MEGHLDIGTLLPGLVHTNEKKTEYDNIDKLRIEVLDVAFQAGTE